MGCCCALFVVCMLCVVCCVCVACRLLLIVVCGVLCAYCVLVSACRCVLVAVVACSVWFVGCCLHVRALFAVVCCTLVFNVRRLMFVGC